MATTPAIANDWVLFGTSAGVVRAVEWASGKPRWQARFGKGAIAGIAVQDAIALVVGEDHELHALEVLSGKQIWELSAEKPVYAPPIVVGSDVFIANLDGVLYAINRRQARLAPFADRLYARRDDGTQGVLLGSVLSDRPSTLELP